MPNNEMDYSLIHRTPDGNGKILVTTPGSPDKGSWETEAELKTYVNQDTVMKTDIVQSLGQQVDKVPSNKAVDDAINAIIEPINYSSITILDNNVSFADTEANCGFKIGNFVLYHLSLNLSAPVSNVDILSFPYAPIDYTRIVYNHQHGSIAMPFVARYTGNLFVAGTLDSGQVSIMVMYKKN